MKIILYTHTDVDYVWPYWFKQMDKLGLPDETIAFINDLDKIHDLRNDYIPIEYDDKIAYTDRVAYCLGFVNPEEVVIFHHEDMFLYDEIDSKMLYEYEEIIKNTDLDLIKLIKANDAAVPTHYHDTLFWNTPEGAFSVQPFMAKAGTLKKVFEALPELSIWEMERQVPVSAEIQKLKSAYAYRNGAKRGMYHYDSDIYPYVATAVIKGKWNTEEYEKELGEILDD
jgi:hypothetical protein